MTRPRLLVVGSGSEPFRGYALRGMARRAAVVLLTARPVTWEAAHVKAAEVVDLGDYGSVLATARRLGVDGILTYDERLVELTARLATDLGLLYTDPEAVRICKDKSLLRELLHASGLSPVRHGVADRPETAALLAEEIGYPVVLKPRALGGSSGVVRVDGPADLPGAFETAASARVGTVRSAYGGVLIEEYLHGPEYSVDGVTAGGVTTPVVIAEKSVGLAPYFEEFGHLVPAPPTPAFDQALELVRAAHRLAGLDRLATHTEFRLTPSGPRLVELNVRLGGGLIPYLGLLASGVDLAAAAADVALGQAPDLVASRHEAAAVRFFYPEADIEVRSVGLSRPASDYEGLDRFIPLVSPGDTLLLPPRAFLSRLALAVVRGPDVAECRRRLDAVVDGFVCDGQPALAGATGTPYGR